MILGDGTAAIASGGATLDTVFRATVMRRPEAVALADPPNREQFTDGPARRLSYAEADRIVSAIAARLRRLGLATDAVIAVQLPNTVEAVLTILGVLRAGMIAALLPLLWRRADMVAALDRVGAKAIVTTAHVAGFDHAALAMQVAAELFPIRHVCGFGSNVKDGMIPFDDLLTNQSDDPVLPLERESPAAHVAVLTFDVAQHGLVAVARNHKELLTGGAAVLLEGGPAQDATILTCCAVNSFAGLALSVLPWLLAGGRLTLHQPFDAEAFTQQCSEDGGVTVVLPGALVPRLREAGLLTGRTIGTVLAAWRAPERLMASPTWQPSSIGFVDVLVFGEIAVVGCRRSADGKPQHLPPGIAQSPRGMAGAITVAELARLETGTLAVRGPMVPRHAFPPGAENGLLPNLPPRAEGFVDTGCPCRLDSHTGTLVVTGPPAGLITVGGCRFAMRNLEEAVRRADPEATLLALPDALGGHRLASQASDPERVRMALEAEGANALLADAFRPRRAREAA